MGTPNIALGTGVGAKPRRSDRILARKPVRASLAIVAMWLAVLFDGIYGGDIVTGGHSATVGAVDTSGVTTIPSAVVIALFAAVATIFVARYGYRGEDREAGDA